MANTAIHGAWGREDLDLPGHSLPAYPPPLMDWQWTGMWGSSVNTAPPAEAQLCTCHCPTGEGGHRALESPQLGLPVMTTRYTVFGVRVVWAPACRPRPTPYPYPIPHTNLSTWEIMKYADMHMMQRPHVCTLHTAHCTLWVYWISLHTHTPQQAKYGHQLSPAPSSMPCGEQLPLGGFPLQPLQPKPSVHGKCSTFQPAFQSFQVLIYKPLTPPQMSSHTPECPQSADPQQTEAATTCDSGGV